MTNTQIERYLRADRELITRLVPEGAEVLDLGCGDGALLSELIEKKHVHGQGLDIDEGNLIRCVERGLSVCQGDLDKGLGDFPDKSYDYVILNQTLQVVKNPDRIIKEMLRVGEYGIVGFPNFGHWLVRLRFLSGGRMPKTSMLPFEWYDTPNIHMLTVLDFKDFCEREKITIEHEEYLICCRWKHSPAARLMANTLALNAVFVIRKH